MPQLGRLQRVELREVWKREAGDFTPWLAQEENLSALAEAIELDLELEATEKNVGPFRADILCKDTATGNWVLVENQLEKTDHLHLGQLITYAAGLKAVTIVWVAQTITQEHRAALDWLNEVTRADINFFGLEVELWRIGDSLAAPKFNVVSKPNDWSESIASAATALADGGLSETRQLQLAYWTALNAQLKATNSKIRAKKPQAQSWIVYALGKSTIYLVASMNTQAKWIDVHVALTGDSGKSNFHELLTQKDAIESEFGGALDWRVNEGRKESQIGLVRLSTDPNDESDWPRQHEWLQQNLERLHSVFSQRVKALPSASVTVNQPPMSEIAP